jgi:hypothetical protein
VKLTFRISGPPIQESDIIELESFLKCSIPQEYRTFLLETNGGEQPDREVFSTGNGEDTLLKKLHSLGGKGFDLRAQIEMNRDRIPTELISIGADAFGNSVCLGISGDRRGDVYFHYHDRGKANPDDEFEPVYFVAHNFEDFIRSLKATPKTEKDEIESLGEKGVRADLLQYLSAGNSLEKTNKYNLTVTQEAARYGNLKLLQVCQEHGASLKGAAHVAAIDGHGAVIDWLLSQGVDINERDKDGKTILARVGFRHKDLAESLQKKGAIKIVR